MKTGIYIDDTGTPSQKSKSKYDSGDWKTWVAMILNSKEREDLKQILKSLSKDLNREIGTNEFHFTEIYSGKKKYRKLSLDYRLSVFQLFVEIYREFKFPIVIQSLTSDDIIRNGMLHWKMLKVSNFDFSKLEDLALWLLLIRIRDYVTDSEYPLPAELFVDSGRQQPNTIQKVGILKEITEKSELKYLASHDEPLIQFIDFVAFSINRTRWILMNDKKSDFDIAFLNILSSANFNVVNLPTQEIDALQFSTENYDTALRIAYDRNGNLKDDEVEKIKKLMKS